MKDFLTKIINEKQSLIEDSPRDYIGASIIGADCMRQIWYEYKGYKGEGVPAKTRRTWSIGKKLEETVLEWAQDSEIEILYKGAYFYADDVPYFIGHGDAVIRIKGMDYILEIKTAKDASFKIFNKKGVYEWNFQYYAQNQSYMGMSGIHNAFILVLNKDTSELSDELIAFDEKVYERLKDKAKIISEYKEPPYRISNSPIWFQCKMCKFNKICHK